ncbi:hypothetical protein FGG08_002128 [Glutinoglossum americanum]|uniref:Uncharacterized protein n=1 Tax=Glutinoglossum americanum TaxID=1670608 RepID=A0A9P8KZH4_9PEZI|nr:hypothetical protein FGG08_002128 [Glutinoglossum americanum]
MNFVRCPENNLAADIEFKTKGYFGGTYNAIGGVIKNEQTQEVLYELSGMWNGEMFIRDTSTGHKEVLFDATHAKPTPPLVRAIEEQEERESQRLWSKVVTALRERNHDVATDEKSKIEERQRIETATRAADGIEWNPRLFRPVHGGPGGPEEGYEDLDWILNTAIDGETPEEQVKQVLSITAIVQGQKSVQRFEIPTRESLEMTRKPHDVGRHGHPGSGTGDLIDLSDDAPAPIQYQRTQDPLNTYQYELAQNLPPKTTQQGAARRKDSETEEVDEFVDAEDGLAY